LFELGFELTLTKKVQTKNPKALLHSRIMRSTRKKVEISLDGVKMVENAKVRSYTPG
jgi:hypothetical protein